MQTFPLNDAVLIDGVYDKKRDVYYFSDASQVRVFSRAQKTWLPSITVPPPPPSVAGTQRFWGLAISPDGSKLAIGDAGTQSIYVVNPDQPSSVATYSLATQFIPSTPGSLAVTDQGEVFAADQGSSGLLSWVGPAPPSHPLSNSPGDFASGLPSMALTSDNSSLYLIGRSSLAWNLNTGGTTALATCSLAPQFELRDLALSASGNHLFSSGCLLDSNGKVLAMPSPDRAELVGIHYVPGTAFSPDGSLLFRAATQTIDAFDSNTGAFVARVSLGTPLSSKYRALVPNGKDSVLAVITQNGNGIALVDVSGIPEPAPPSYLQLPAPLAQ
jgi:hypothetical protein